ncbi:MotA/TolQ/ExbB proton channel family protein [Porphyromonas gingivalis]|uniref:MotA/TolQ/ExbB proton channel family protein n=1 Tax=Porphyromonas gingivalis TaxID=837 RepID=UPI0004059420|nr:MotA/TolQ/ExbB proton channel family protein [Porphyromonas gingivalis]
MNFLSNVMFWVSNGLLVPVVAGLIYLFIKSLLLLGTLFGTWQSYRSRQETFARIIENKAGLDTEALRAEAAKRPHAPFENVLAEVLDADSARRNLLIGRYELSREQRLSSAKVLTKFGPILGLMGTLIPMGPALVGLSTGDIGQMAYNMQVAFATTVIGMFASAVGYIALHIVRTYNRNDLVWLDYINEKLS